jgi:hypothetical protein
MAAPRWQGRVVLDWSKSGSVSAAAQPCVLCGRPALMIGPAGKPCHKTCAEDWTERREADR